MLLPFFCVAAVQHNGPIVRTTRGTIRGIHAGENANAFLGVPYAAPPVGDLRFQPPQALLRKHDDENIDGTQLRSACMQHRYNNVLKDYLAPDDQSEDCLHLNVFVPRMNDKGQPLPTLVWFHGGSMSEGANN